MDTVVTRDQLRQMLERMVAANAGMCRKSDAQRHVDAAVEACLREGYIELGAALGLINGFQAMGGYAVAQALTALLEVGVDLNPGELRRQIVEGG